MIWNEQKHPRDKQGRFTDGSSLAQELIPDKEINDLKSKSVGELKEIAQSKSEKERDHRPKNIGKINFADEEVVISTLDKYEKVLVELPYESSITITTDGSIWQVDGTAVSVDTTVIPHSLEGSYSYHNHPKDTTWYSFSADDVDFFLTHKEQSSRASDDKYFYSMTRTDKTPDNITNSRQEFAKAYRVAQHKSFRGEIDIDVDGYHETLILLAEKYNFAYERIKK